MVIKVWISLEYTTCDIGVHFSKDPASVQSLAKAVDHCAFTESIA